MESITGSTELYSSFVTMLKRRIAPGEGGLLRLFPSLRLWLSVGTEAFGGARGKGAGAGLGGSV